MRRFAIWLLAIVLIFSGCAAQQEDPFRVDTVVQIPIDPTQAPTEPSTEPATEAPTEAPTDAPTEPEETAAPKTYASNQGSSSGKGSSGGKKQSSKDQKTDETEEIGLLETLPPTEAPAEPPFDPSTYSVGNLEYAILDELNASRADAGAAELSLSGRLSGIAYLRAKEAADAWGHTRPDGRDYTSALSDYGYGYSTSAELMVHVAGSGDAAQIVSKWMNSKSHSKSILSDSYATAGIGVYSAAGVTYVVCLLVG